MNKLFWIKKSYSKFFKKKIITKVRCREQTKETL